MKGTERLAAVDSSTPRIERMLPEMPIGSAVMIRLLRISVFGMSAFFEPLFRSLKLSENGLHVMCLLVASDNSAASPSELTDLIGTTRANMTRILDELVTDGYVARTTSSRDGRRQVVEINSAGRRKVREALPKLAGPMIAAFSGLSDDEMKQLNGLLRKLIKSFDENALVMRTAA